MIGRILSILRFGQPYLKRYWGRFAAGILLGALFGLSNASFVWATKTIFERLDPNKSSQSEIVLKNTGSSALDWSSSTNKTVNVTPAEGTLPGGASTNLAVTVLE